jgi:hypothetical protein
VSLQGSPPLARGAPVAPVRRRLRVGLTPARAGSTLVDQPIWSAKRSLAFGLGGPYPMGRRPNFRRLLAALHPAAGGSSLIGAAWSDVGRTIKVRPSKSVGVQWWLCTRKSIRCSPCTEKTISALPPAVISHTFSHRRSRTRADTCPTNTPAEISTSHRVRWPRSPARHVERTMTTIRSLFRNRTGFRNRPRT